VRKNPLKVRNCIKIGYTFQGTSVEFWGKYDIDGPNNSSVEYGTILATNVTQWVGSYYHTDQVKTDIEVHPGDSGGPLTYWIYKGSASADRYVMGICSSRHLEDRDGDGVADDPYSIFTSVDNIYYELDLTTYFD